VPLEVVPGHFQRPKRGRRPAEEGLAAVAAEGNPFVAAAVAEEAIERMDCFVDSKEPKLPFPDPPEGVVAAAGVHQKGPHRWGQRVARRKDFRRREERRVQERRVHQRDHFRPRVVPEELRPKDQPVGPEAFGEAQLHKD